MKHNNENNNDKNLKIKTKNIKLTPKIKHENKT